MKIGKVVMAVVLSVVLAVAPAFAEKGKLGQVDMGRVFYEYEKQKLFSKEMQDYGSKKAAERDKVVAEAKKLREGIEMLGDKARAEREKELNAKVSQLNEMDKAIRQEIYKRENEMLNEIMNDIRKVVDVIAKADGFELIFDSRGIVYAQDRNADLTDRVIKELNKK